MEALGTDKLVAALGLAPEVARFYLRILPLSGRPVEELLQVLRLGRAEFDVLSGDLVGAGTVSFTDAGDVDGVASELVEVLAPAQALSRIIESAADRARGAYEQLLSVSRAVPYLVADSTREARPAPEDATEPLDGEVVLAGTTGETLSALIQRTTGDLLWLRPYQWTAPWEEEMHRLIGEGVARGRSVRAIYPIRALSDAPAIVEARREIGEEIRLLPHVPTRLLVIGTSHAVLPDPLGSLEPTQRVVVRQRGIVEGFALYFEQLWTQASRIEEYERGASTEERRQLLRQLAGGAQDEQIARRLGLSLRTVRRRVAELLDELGATSRIQAGVEAANRGWLRSRALGSVRLQEPRLTPRLARGSMHFGPSRCVEQPTGQRSTIDVGAEGLRPT